MARAARASSSSPGAILLAQMSGRPILPMAYAASRAWLIKWDKFVIPWPFSRIVIADRRAALRARVTDAAAALEALQTEMAAELKRLFDTGAQGVSTGRRA